jgi:hypothetical protein
MKSPEVNMSRKELPALLVSDDPNDLIWGVGGVDGIAAALNIPQEKTSTAYNLIKQGRVEGVTKLGHRTIVASRSKLRLTPN